MSYLVLARKWRPQSFDDLIGQEHVSRTLGNAIAQGRVAHAFLFTGVRGVGKTTSARILAKALNCAGRPGGSGGGLSGPTVSPCLECSACKEIAAGVDVDVQEIDGASHTGVDDVRRIQETLPYRPARDRFKILIVDEVHMLSGSAWNAFLKTLEEPPPHVKFIFATTEVHKVPITILSRCQRYDFKMISAQAIAARVRYILGEEKIQADDAAVQLVAREAAGSMRDALSILDQVIAFSGASEGGLRGDEVARVLGVADRQALQGLASAVVNGKAAEALQELDRLASGGFDLAHVARDLLRRFRDLVVARVVAEPEPLLDLADAELADVTSLAATASADDLARLFQGFSRALDDIARSSTPRHVLEVALVRLARRPALQPVDALLERLADLERRLSGGGGGGGGGGGARPQQPSAPRSQGGPAQNAPPMRSESFGTAPRAAFEAPRTDTNAPRAQGSAQAQGSAHAHAHGATSTSASTSTSTSAQTRTATGGQAGAAPSAAPSIPPTGGILAATGERFVQPQEILESPTIDRLRETIAKLRTFRGTWGSLLEHGVVIRCDAQKLEVAYERRSFLAAQVSDTAVSEAIDRAARETLGGGATIWLCDVPARGLTLAQLANQVRTAAQAEARDAALSHPSVRDAIEIFSAEVRDVKLPGDDR